jgi:hypothetical protein
MIDVFCIHMCMKTEQGQLRRNDGVNLIKIYCKDMHKCHNRTPLGIHICS